MLISRQLIKHCLHVFINLIFFSVLVFDQHATAQDKKPNIIFILGDDIGYKIPVVNGGKSYTTPNLDRMAAEGMNFTGCHATPLCAPSRIMLLTGKYNFRNYTNWGDLDTNQRTIANMLQDAGYKTACFGKWQLNGGEASVHAFGFENYCIWDPLNQSDKTDPRYKNPYIYTNGAYVPDSLTTNKYGEDIFTDSVVNFITRNKKNPFFIYYPMVLAHPPFQPTPDDSAFATWTSVTRGDTAFYPSMIKYMDKKIGLILDKVKELGLENNTVIIYTGDNGTPFEITEYVDNDSAVVGYKGSTVESGYSVPMMIDWGGTIKPGSVNNDLIEFTDFLPTFAHIANIPLPKNYGPLDGVDFTPRLKGHAGEPRDWLFYDFNAHPGLDTLKRWAQTDKYKLYDTSLFSTSRLFFNIKKDPDELNPLSRDSLTFNELAIKQELLKVINGYVHQGTAILQTPQVTKLTDSSVTIEDSIKVNGGSTIKIDGIVWGTESNPVYPSFAHSSDGTITGPFEHEIKNRKADTRYYVRGYARNIAGISYSDEIKFKTLMYSPVALAATPVNKNGFTAHWTSVNAATTYKIDVSKDSTFSKIKPSKLVQQFNNGIRPPIGWTFSESVGANDSIYGTMSPALELRDSGTQVITKKLGGPATELQFWIEGYKTLDSSSLLVEGFDGNDWTVIKHIVKLPASGIIKLFNATSNPPLEKKFIQFRFTFLKSRGNLILDDISIKYNNIIPFYVDGYHGLEVSDTSYTVSGLDAGANYYYRVRANEDNNESDNSNVISVTTCTSQTCNGNMQTSVSNNMKLIKVFPNPSSGEFYLLINNKTNDNIHVFVTDVYGKKLYQTTVDNSHVISFGKDFSSGIYFLYAEQQGNIQTFKLIKEH